jgi:D-lactate dehydrogenase
VDKLRGIAEHLAEEVIVPLGTGCCGMAGDRGLLHPELPAAALAGTAEELAACAPEACLSANRTCEIALRTVTGRPYESFVAPLERLTRATASVPGGGAREPAAGAV